MENPRKNVVIMREIEYWNEKKEYNSVEERRSELRKLMMQSASGRALLKKEDLEKRVKENKTKRETEIRSYSPSFKQEKRYSMTDVFRSMIEGQALPAEARKFDEAGDNVLVRSGINTGYGFHLPLETRDILAKDVPIASFIDKYNKAIRDRLVLARLGASLLTVTGRSVLPTYTGSTSTWEGEISAAKSGKGTFSKKELTPKRITTKLTISRQLLNQGGNIDDFLVADLSESVSAALESAVFGKHEHTDIMPDGLFTGKSISPELAQHSAVLSLESDIKHNGQPMAFCMHGTAEKTLKAAPRGNSTVINNNLCDDYPYITTDVVPTFDGNPGYGIIFGRWSDLVIAQWGGIEILFNPYTKAITGECEFIVNSYFDFTYRPESFSFKAIY